MQDPKFGILTTIAETILDGKIVDAIVIPITLNYEKVLEGDTYPYELMGETKVKESLGRLIKASKILGQSYGKVYIEVCEPIIMSKYMQDQQLILKTTERK